MREITDARNPRICHILCKYRTLTSRTKRRATGKKLHQRISRLHRYHRRLAALGLVVNLVVPISSYGQANCTNSPHTLVTENSIHSGQNDVAMDSDGDYVIVWEESTDGSGLGIFAQRYDVSGIKVGAEIPVNTNTAMDQTNPAVAMDADGDFVIVWDGPGDGDGLTILAQRFSANGTKLGPEFIVNTFIEGAQENPAVAMNAEGDFAVTWDTPNDVNNGKGIYARLFDDQGMPQGNEFKVHTYYTGDQDHPDIAMDAVGNFVVVWQCEDPSPALYRQYGQRFDSAGSRLDGEFFIGSGSIYVPTHPKVAMDNMGNFAIAFENERSSYDVYHQRYDANGVALGTTTRVNINETGDQRHPDIAMDANGEYVITWAGDAEAIDQGVYGKIYQADGSFAGAQFVVESTRNFEDHPSVAMDFDGDFVITYDNAAVSDEEVYQRLYRCCPAEYAAASGSQLSGPIIGSGSYEASNLIESTQRIQDGEMQYDAGNEIELLAGFEVKPGASLVAKIDGCP